MSAKDRSHTSEQESRQVAEASRQREWKQPSFLRELFLGNFRLDLISPFPAKERERPEFRRFYAEFREFLKTEVDSVQIDETGEYPEHVLRRLREMKAFGMKIPAEFGGLGFDQVEYGQVMKLLGATDGNLTALLSAHQSIGVPQPLKLFGTREQKEKYLPRCAAGEISAFALTEPEVGSDPARVSTTAVLSKDGEHYILNGEKLWCTNGTIASLIVVMARNPEDKRISAFVVDSSWPGVEVVVRCRFMGLRALANAVIVFKDVRVPRENLIGEEGRGLKIALTTLNDGRLSIPNASVGAAKKCLEISRKWAAERVQWGRPIGKHEAIAQMIADMAATTFAMESVADLATQMSDRGEFDIRLEAAAAKEWNTTEGWKLIDDMVQIRGGRGYETESSLEGRGETPVGAERMMRDFRINRIFEGSSEIMHLFMAREAVDKHLEVAGALVDPGKSLSEKLRVLPSIITFYAFWYPTRWLGWGYWPKYSEFGRLSKHLRFCDRNCRKLARQIFHGMIIHRQRLERKQAFLFRIVAICNELFAMSASISRAHSLKKNGRKESDKAIQLTDQFCRSTRRRVKQLFRDLWQNDDEKKYKLASAILKGEYPWLESGIIELDGSLSVRKVSPQTSRQAEHSKETDPVSTT